MTFASMTVGTPANDTESHCHTDGTSRLASATSGAGAIAYDARSNTASETRPGGENISVAYGGHGRLTTYTRSGDPAQAKIYNRLVDKDSVICGSTTRS